MPLRGCLPLYDLLCYPFQVIITCRTEYLEAKGSYRGLFTPGDATRTSSRLHELFVRAFGGKQVSQYFAQWVKQRDVNGADTGDVGGGNGGVHARSRWSAERYVDVITTTPGLQELAQTPFVLRAMADALPRLSSSASSSTHKITRADVYGAFIDECWEVETRRLQRNWPPGLPADYDAPLSFTNYCTDLAVDMLARGQVKNDTGESLSFAACMGCVARACCRPPSSCMHVCLV